MITLLWMLLLTDPATAPATRPLSLELLRAQHADDIRAAAADLPELAPRPLSQVIKLGLHDGLIQVDPVLGNSEGVHRITLTDCPGITTIKSSPGDALANQAAYLDFQHVDIAPAGGIYELLQVFAIDARVQMSVDAATQRRERTTQLIQSPTDAEDPKERVRLYFDEYDAATDEQVLHEQFTAASFSAMLSEHPAEIYDRLIKPLQRRHMHADLLATPPELAWQVLGDEITLPEALSRRVNALVEQLNGEDFKTRESAAATLKELGPPAAVMLRRLDRSKLSEEQRGAIQSLLAPYSQIKDEAAEKLRSDRMFLLGCLYIDEPAFWPAAAKHLAQRFSVEVRVGDTQDAMRAEADRVLEKLIPAPTTQAAK